MVILTVLIIILIIWGFYYHLKNVRLYQFSWNVPGPLNLPFIGAAYRYTGTPIEIGAKIIKTFDEYPDISKLWVLDELYYLVSKPEYLQIILSETKALQKPPVYKNSQLVLGQGLLTSNVNLWKKHRKMIAPAFNKKLLNQYPRIISEHCAILLDIFENLNGQEIDYCKYITNCSIDSIGETFFDQQLKTQFSKISYSQVFDDIMEAATVRCINKIYAFDIVYENSDYFTRLTANFKIIKELVNSIINKQIRESKRSFVGETGKMKSFISIAVEAYLTKQWNMQELEDEVITMLLAGSDTVASLVSFVLILLAMHPKAQEKVYTEALNVLGFSRLIELEDLPSFTYTERVIKETLRLFPGAPFTGRLAEADIDLGDYIIPKSASIFVGSISLHRNDKYWVKPLMFDPDRFLPENSLSRHPYSWIPFSAGPRGCIGFKSGMMTTKIMVALIIRTFKVSTTLKKVEDIEITTNVVLKPKRKDNLRFNLRSKGRSRFIDTEKIRCNL